MADDRPVPVKTILVTIGLVVLTGIGLYLAVKLAHIWTLLLVALFFAVLFTPPVNFVCRFLHVRQGLATGIVLIASLALLAGMLYAFISPLVTQTREFINNFPQYVADARAGRGTVGELVRKYNLDKRIEENHDRINKALNGAGGSAVGVARKVFAGIVSTLTVIVLAILMILYGPEMMESGLGVLSPPRRARVKLVATDCARAITGYAMGNLLISVIAGTVTFIGLWAFGVPFKGVLALFVAFADLIPLVGATLGAIPTIFVSFLHSTTAGIGMIVVYVVYQQFENHVLQVTIMSKTVHINQLVVLVSVLIGVELFGFLGALLAIPAAGIIQVIGRDLWDHRAGRPKEEPTVGADKVPVSEVIAEEQEAHRDTPELEAAEPDTPELEAAEPHRPQLEAGKRERPQLEAPAPDETAVDEPAPTVAEGAPGGN